jgi:hypothetical protein
VELWDAGGESVIRHKTGLGVRYEYRPRLPMLRCTVNIEKAARLTVREGPHGPRFVKWQEAVSDRAPGGESHEGPPDPAPRQEEAWP